MKRALKALITILCALALACSGTAVFAQSGADEAGGYTDAVSAFADAEQSARTEKTETWELFLPSSSEQFLPLTSPNDVAISDDYIAVADGNVIYVYDRAAGAYGTFSGTVGLTYSSLCFYGNYLFFVASGGNINITYFDCTSIAGTTIDAGSTQELKDEEGNSIPCSSFILNGKSLYYATTTSNSVSLLCRKLNTETLTVGAAGSNLAPKNTSNTAPYFTIFNGQTYYSLATGSSDIYSVDGNTSTPRYNACYTVYSFAIVDGTCYYSSANDNHYFYAVTNSDGDQPLNDENGTAVSNVTAIEVYNNELYLVTGSSVKAYSTDSSSYTGYEIAQYSAGITRLGRDAKSLSLHEDRLVIADPANARVLVYDMQTQTYASVAVTDLGNSFFVCAGEENFLVCNGSFIRMFSYGGKAITTVPQDDVFDGNITDCTYSYDSYYLLTGSNVTYRVSDTGITATGQLAADYASIAADIEGNIWAFSSDSNTAYCYTEANFLSQSAAYSETVLLGANVLDILVDYEGTVYGLTEDSVLVGGATDARQLDLSSYVSYADDAAAVAFAFGFTTDEAYVLTDAGFLVKWSGGIASLDTIDENGAYSALTGALTDENGGADACGDLLVTISADAVLVSLDESALTAENYLPAAGYARAGEARVGVKVTDIADPDGGNTIGSLVALYEYLPGSGAQGSQHTYSLCLVLGEGAQPLASSEYYTDTAGYAGYTTNAVGLYNLPLMRQSGDTAYLAYRLELAKNTRVTVLGTVSLPTPTTGGYGLDADYCFVSYSADGQTVYGFVPASYLNASPSSGITGSGSAEITYRHIAEGESVTLYDDAENARVFENEELLTVYGEADENGLVFVRYTADGISYSGWIEEALLAEASDFGIWVLVAVTIVTAAVLASACYLVLRKPPVMEAPLPAEEDADGDGSPESGTDLPDETDGHTPPQDGGQSGR